MSTLGPRDVGHRVVVRRRLTDGRLTDILGVLQSVEPAALAVRRADASVEVIPLADVTVAKTIPALPLRAVDRDRLPLITALGRPAAETARIGDWRLRASNGWTGRGNSLLPVGDPGINIQAALDKVVAFYAERGLPPLALVVLGTPIESTLRSRGWVEARPDQSDTLVMHTTLDLVNAEPSWPVSVASRPDPDWYHVALSGTTPADVVKVVLEGAPVAGFASIHAEGRVVAVGRAAATGDWVGLDAIEVSPEHRRRGLGAAVVRGLARWGGERGCRRTYLEVVEENIPAVAAYRSLGYTEAYRYRYLTVGLGS